MFGGWTVGEEWEVELRWVLGSMVGIWGVWLWAWIWNWNWWTCVGGGLGFRRRVKGRAG